jgi:hypothetical protein
MSKAPSLKDRLVTAAGPQPGRIAEIQARPAPVALGASSPKAREGKTMVAGYFSPDFARAVKMLAVERGVSVQALIGEGLDALLHQHGKHPFGER